MKRIILAALLAASTSSASAQYVGKMPPGTSLANPKGTSQEPIPSMMQQFVVTDYGFKANSTFDNATQVPTLMAGLGSAYPGAGYGITFPPIPGTNSTVYYFASPFSISKGTRVSCGGPGVTNGVTLLFAPGVDGVVNEGNEGLAAWIDIDGCTVISLGRGTGTATSASAIITSANFSLSYPTAPAPAWGAGDGIIATLTNKFPAGNAIPPSQWLAVPAGAYIDTAVGSTLTLHSGFTSNASGGVTFWQLPAAQAFSFNSTTGSNTITITAGPRKMQSGDMLWSDAFPFGSLVRTASGSSGAQTITVSNLYETAGQNATKTYTGGSGKLWVVPAGIKRRLQARSHRNQVTGFPLGLSMACSSIDGLLCTTSYDQENVFSYGLIGRFVSGNNTGASTSTANEYYHNYLTDIGEFGTLGTLYLGDNTNSSESSNSTRPLLANCQNQNASNFIGMYTGYTGDSDNDKMCAGNTLLSDTPSATSLTRPWFFGTPAGLNDIGIDGGNLYGNWSVGIYPNQCAQLKGRSDAAVPFGISIDCQRADWGIRYESTRQEFSIIYREQTASIPWMTYTTGYASVDPYVYPSYGGTRLVAHPQGTLIGNYNQLYPNQFRRMTAGTSGYFGANSLRGDIHFNLSSATGGVVGWTNTADGANPAAFGPVANDATGTRWTLPRTTHTPTTIASLGSCTAGLAGTVASVSDGDASLGWGVTVVNTGAGGTYYLVNCNGSNWTVVGK